MIRLLPVHEGRVPPSDSRRAWLAERDGGARLHAGIDIGRAGQLVIAPEQSTVELVARASYADDEPRRSTPEGWSGYGPIAVVLRGDSGYVHLLGHLGDAFVRAGDRLAAGAPIGTIADRSASGQRVNHVHWEVRRLVRPPSRDVATIEICDDPVRWLIFLPAPWRWEEHGCPVQPDSTSDTPRACRPGVVDAAAIAPIALDVEPRPGAPPARPPLARVELDGERAARAASASRSRSGCWSSRLGGDVEGREGSSWPTSFH